MQFENNFVYLGRGQMVDPMLQIRMRAGRWELDRATQWIDVELDPEIRSDRLVAPMTEADIQDFKLARNPLPADGLIPFESKRSRTIFFDFFYEEWRNETLALRCAADTASIASTRSYLDRQLQDLPANHLRAHALELLDYIMRNILNYYRASDIAHSHWSRRPNKLVLLLQKSFAEHLPSYRSRPSTADPSGYVVFDEQLGA